MTSVVFLGPSLPLAEAKALLPDATFLGPAECGDIYRCGARAPRAIALVDGYFDQRLAVWHKELLWALSQGITVYGAASMGALRAVELEPFGMLGVGEVFEQYRSGALEDDDEVAIVHEPVSQGYRPTSDAMVNIRATLRAARSQGVIDSTEEAELIQDAKQLFYPDRSFVAILRKHTATRAGFADGLDRWFTAHGLVDQKRADTKLLLERVKRDQSAGHASAFRRFHFERTQYFHVLRQTIDQARAHGRATPQASESSLPVGCQRSALRRALALLLAEHEGATTTQAELQHAADEFRQALGLLTPEATQRWLADAGLELDGFSGLLRDNVLVQRFGTAADRLAEQQLRAAALQLFHNAGCRLGTES
jgi:hypothetical protein